jgi:hypothetical protein
VTPEAATQVPATTVEVGVLKVVVPAVAAVLVVLVTRIVKLTKSPIRS